MSAPPESSSPICTLHVCTSCRDPGSPREPQENRAGYQLYHQVREAIETHALHRQVDVKPAPCLSICPRPCGIALSLAGSWTYLFGDQVPNKTVDEIVDCLSLYLESDEGFMVRDKRPKSLRRSILGRVPPSQEV